MINVHQLSATEISTGGYFIFNLYVFVEYLCDFVRILLIFIGPWKYLPRFAHLEHQELA